METVRLPLRIPANGTLNIGFRVTGVPQQFPSPAAPPETAGSLDLSLTEEKARARNTEAEVADRGRFRPWADVRDALRNQSL